MVSVRSAVYDLRQCRTRLERILSQHERDVLTSTQVSQGLALVAFMRYLEDQYGDQADADDRKADWFESSEEDLEPGSATARADLSWDD